MKKIFGARGVSAARGIIALAAATAVAGTAVAQGASAQSAQKLNPQDVGAEAAAATAQPTLAKTVYLANGKAVAAMTSTPSAALVQAPFAMAQTLPLSALVAMNSVGAPLDEQANCLAVAVYHEARGESLEGQLAVANVIINRTNSPKYPDSWCKVMKQPWQFSFVNPRTGRYPAVNVNSRSWANAQAIARIAAGKMAAEVDPDVLWYHADYVAPSWGRRLQVTEKIGTHIFYRA